MGSLPFFARTSLRLHIAGDCPAYVRLGRMIRDLGACFYACESMQAKRTEVWGLLLSKKTTCSNSLAERMGAMLGA